MFTFRLKLIAAFLLILSLLGCRPEKSIKVGFIGGLSGRQSQLSVTARNALHLAVREKNRAGGLLGKEIELIVMNHGGNLEEAAMKMELLYEEGVDVIIGPLTSQMIPAVEAMGDRDLLIISPTISGSKLSGRDDNFVRMIPGAFYQGDIIAKTALDLGIKEVGIVRDESNALYTREVADTFQRVMESKGGTVLLNRGFFGEQKHSFTSLVEEIVSVDPEALFFCTSAIDAAALCQQLRKRAEAIQYFGSVWTKTNDIIEHGGRTVEGMIQVGSYQPEGESDEYKRISGLFEEVYQKKMNFASLYTYESFLLFCHAVETTKSTGRDALLDAICGEEFQGLQEKMIFTEYGDVLRQQTITMIKDGRFVTLFHR